MDFSDRLDALQQRAAAAKTEVQAAAAESREQLRQRIDQTRASSTGPPLRHSRVRRRPPPRGGASGRR